jgi:hypothetical protein
MKPKTKQNRKFSAFLIVRVDLAKKNMQKQRKQVKSTRIPPLSRLSLDPKWGCCDP